MSRDPIALTIPDISTFAKALRDQLETPPSHLEVLGVIARAAGFRNYQHLRARLSETPATPVDDRLVTKALRHFDAAGQFTDWPARWQVQKLCLWALWARLPAREIWTEREISAWIHDQCTFRDAAQIRRTMLEHNMVTRNLDGSQYQRQEQKPPPEAEMLITRVNKR